MLTTSDRSHLNQFCTRTAALGSEVYVVAKRGKNAARLDQLFRIDPPDEGFDASTLAHDLISRLSGNPSELPTWLWVCVKGTADKRDSIRLEPVALDEPDLQDSQSMGHLTHALTAMTRETLLGNTQVSMRTQAAMERLQDRYDDLQERYTTVAEEAATLRALDSVNATSADLYDDEPPDPMSDAWTTLLKPILGPILQVAMTKQKQLSGPVAQAGQTPTPPPDAHPSTVLKTWGPEQVRALADTFGLVAEHRPELVDDDVAERLHDAIEHAARPMSDDPSEPEGDERDDLADARDLVANAIDAIRVALEEAPEAMTDEHRAELALLSGASPVEVPAVTTWTPEAANAVVALVEDLATNHVDLVTDEHLERLLAPLQERVAAFLFGGG